uniref:Uncharacterized protein n=1 Tax=Leersia perrieri TaxID=77586 RepID=A0A0D9XWF6_9ORYZ
MAADAYPIQLLHRQPIDCGGDGQWRNLGAAHAAVRLLRPQGTSLVLYSGPDQRRIVFAYPILAGDVFERLDGETLYWEDPDCGDQVALCFADEAACAAVSGAVSPATTNALPSGLDGLAERLAGMRVAREDAPPTEDDDIAVRLAGLSIGRRT